MATSASLLRATISFSPSRYHPLQRNALPSSFNLTFHHLPCLPTIPRSNPNRRFFTIFPDDMYDETRKGFGRWRCTDGERFELTCNGTRSVVHGHAGHAGAGGGGWAFKFNSSTSSSSSSSQARYSSSTSSSRPSYTSSSSSSIYSRPSDSSHSSSDSRSSSPSSNYSSYLSLPSDYSYSQSSWPSSSSPSLTPNNDYNEKVGASTSKPPSSCAKCSFVKA